MMKMIQRRDFDPNSWSADLSVSLDDADNLDQLLEAIVRRYHLLGGVIATDAGVVQAQYGGAVSDLEQLAAAIDTSVLPRYFANGPFDAYVDIVAPGMIALLMRQRPDGETERDELTMVSDYKVAKQMTEELRAEMVRIADR
jgi:hypothetical protein